MSYDGLTRGYGSTSRIELYGVEYEDMPAEKFWESFIEL
jgi:hypothetical protein